MNLIYEQLKPIIDECYQVFSIYEPPTGDLNACNCPLCLEPELEHELKTLPLRKIRQKHFYRYNSASKDNLENPNEIKYFLPRMIELFVQGKDIHFAVELSFERIGRCLKGSFSQEEQMVWEKFVNTYLDTLLQYYPYQVFEFLMDNIFNHLLMFSIAKADIEPFLERWRNTDTPQATTHYLYASYAEYWYDGEFYIEGGFNDYSTDFMPKMGEWLTEPSNKLYYANKIKKLDTKVIKEVREFGDFYPNYLEDILVKLNS